LQYCSLPGIIADQFFRTLQANCNQTVSEKDFVKGLARALVSDLDEKIKLTFDM